MKLPGAPFKANLKCPACGWKFELGLRKMGEIDEGDEERCITCCSKCLANIEFKPDGSDAKVITSRMLADYSPEVRLIVHKGQFLAWLSQQQSKGMVQ